MEEKTKFVESRKKTPTGKIALVDIDETICFYPKVRRYDLAEPCHENISKINNLYNKGWEIVYWTARGSISGIDYEEYTKKQLDQWGCKYHDLITGTSPNPKPAFDLVIDDKARRIEEI